MLVAVTGAGPSQGSKRRQLAFQALAQGAAKVGLSMHVVTPGVRSLRTGQGWYGWRWQGNVLGPAWRLQGASVTPQADVLYDAMYLADLRHYRHTYRRFIAQARTQGYVVFNPGLPHKDVLYDWLAGHPDLHMYLPVTWHLSNPHQVEQALSRYMRLWLKPVYGSGGRHMVYLEKTKNQMWHLTGERFYGNRLDISLDWKHLHQWLTQLQQRRPYLLQEDISLLRTPKGSRVDFRVTLVRNQRGLWQVIAITARTAAPQSLLTNFHAGGQVKSLTILNEENSSWLQSLGMYSNNLATMRELGFAVAGVLQSHEPLLGLVGLDVGRSEQGRWFVYDWNVRPGRDILTDAELVECMTTVAGYAHYLHQNLGRTQVRSMLTRDVHESSALAAH
ncbi:hypothetical protein D2Q93_01825 [Alicyclobacillaceae bacterium I2511]|nr:hypothetical protein D2Q93_01825 [Alicyclobacillaceae bacterium I2511]